MAVVTALQLAELADSLGMVVGAFDRSDHDPRLSRSETSRLLRIADVLDQAQRLLGDRARGLQWLKHQNRALGFKSPLVQLETSAGTKRVLALLHKLERGRFP